MTPTFFRHHSFFRFLNLVILLASLSACAGFMDKSKKLDRLDMTLNEFRKSLRWGYVENAASFIQLKNHSQRLRDHSDIENVRITSYEHKILNLNEDQSEAEVLAQISFYDVNHGTVLNMTEQQHWWLDMEKKMWFLDGDLPNFRAAMR